MVPVSADLPTFLFFSLKSEKYRWGGEQNKDSTLDDSIFFLSVMPAL